MKFPTNTTCLTEARMYAIDSINHTYNYKGWEDAWEKSARIITGKFCQLWLGEYCRLNDIPYEKDVSSPFIHDNGDLFINGWNIDCKGTINDAFAGQISKQFDGNNTIDYYAFFKTDKNYSYVEPLGFIHKSNVLNNSKKVFKGELIPHTSIKQKFEEYSYFVDTEKIKSFFNGIDSLACKSKSAASDIKHKEWIDEYNSCV